MVQHRFRVAKERWPLVQIGPGVLTVNETDSYVWDDFRTRCEAAVEQFFDAHPAKEELKIQDLTLRYIDAVSIDFNRESVFDFLREKMKTNLSLPTTLFENEQVVEKPSAFNWQVSFNESKPGGFIILRFAMGEHKGQPALVWETQVQTSGDRVPGMPASFSKWLDEAHDLTDEWFFKMIEGELERRFAGG